MSVITPTFLRVNRIGQISGTTSLWFPHPPEPNNWPLLIDAVGNPLLTDTGPQWNAIGFDEGANAEHSDGRLYIFTGDVATDQVRTPINADLVAWVDEPTPLRHGGHLALGWNFVLPNTHQGATNSDGQPDWRFCSKCHGLFWAPGGHATGTICPRDSGNHDPQGWIFVLPNAQQGAPLSSGQANWAHCAKCGSLFYLPDVAKSVCPNNGGNHSGLGSWNFILPNKQPGAPDPSGQPDWRYCNNCKSLFFDGFPSKGICVGSPGGGIHINAVTKPDGTFDPFSGDSIGYTGSFETPNGAFSVDGRMYVCAGIADPTISGRVRPGDPQLGQYLFSKDDPSKPAPPPYETEFLLSPKLGWCATDRGRTAFQSHSPLGWHFLLPRNLPPAQGRVSGFRCCLKCEAVYFDPNAQSTGVCQRGGPHVPDPNNPDVFSLEKGLTDDAQNQANWKQCKNCFAMYWFDTRTNDTGLCPATGQHQPTDDHFRVPHTSMPNLAHEGGPQGISRYRDSHRNRSRYREYGLRHNPGADPNIRDQLRLCVRCHGLVRTDQESFGWTSPTVVLNREHPVLPPCPEETGVVMISYGGFAGNFRLSWMPIASVQRPRFDSIQYFHVGKRKWTDTIDSSPGCELFAMPPYAQGQYSHVSASWLPEPACWVVLYGTASNDTQRFTWDKPILARFSDDLLTWSLPVPLFDPNRENAYGHWMHDPAIPGDHINPNIPPHQPPPEDNKGWAYGAFLIDRYTTFNPVTRELNLTYLMSTGSPYQVHLMETTVLLPIPAPCPLLFYNGDDGPPMTASTATVDKRGAYHPGQILSGFGVWTNVVGTPGGGVLFYNANDGSAATAVVDRDGNYNFGKSLDSLGIGWTHITSVGQNGLFFYAYDDEVGGEGSTALLDGSFSGNFTWVDEIFNLPQWSHVVGCLNGALLFYKSVGGIGATATVDHTGAIGPRKDIDSSELFAGWTNIAAVGAGSLIFYNAGSTDGGGATAFISESGEYTPGKSFTSLILGRPWTDVVGLTNGSVFSYKFGLSNADKPFAVTGVIDQFGNYLQRSSVESSPYTSITAAGSLFVPPIIS